MKYKTDMNFIKSYINVINSVSEITFAWGLKKAPVNQVLLLNQVLKTHKKALKQPQRPQ